MPNVPSLRDQLRRLEARYGRDAFRAEIDRPPKTVDLLELDPMPPPRKAGQRGRNFVNDEGYLGQMALLIVAQGGLKRSRRDISGVALSAVANRVLKHDRVHDRLRKNRARVLCRKFKADAPARIAEAERALPGIGAAAAQFVVVAKSLMPMPNTLGRLVLCFKAVEHASE